MTTRPRDGTATQSSRDKRLSEALKANLSRRKQQQRQRAGSAPTGSDADEAANPHADVNRSDPPVAGNNDLEESS